MCRFRPRPVILFASFLILWSLPCSAWKARTHIYISNLLIREMMESRAGGAPRLGIDEDRHGVPAELADAVLAYPECFRAGAMGPDVFPDISIGQSIIHPGGCPAWIDHMWRRRQEYEGAERARITAFLLGFMVHAASDAFGHTWVNSYAGGPFPTLSDGMTAAERANVMTHVALETCIDRRIPTTFQSSELYRISVPVEFLYRETIVEGDISHGLNGIYAAVKAVPEHLVYFIQARGRLRAEADRMNVSWYEYLYGAGEYKQAKKAYMEAWIEDIDAGMLAWVGTSAEAAQRIALDESFERVIEPIKTWSVKHLISMAGAPDAAGWVVEKLGNLGDMAALILGDLAEPIENLEKELWSCIIQRAVGISLAELEGIFSSPESWFTKDVLSMIEAEMENFSTETRPEKIRFAAFYNSLILSKMVLIAARRADDLGAGRGIVGGTPEDAPGVVGFVESLDGSEQWKDSGWPFASPEIFSILFMPQRGMNP